MSEGGGTRRRRAVSKEASRSGLAALIGPLAHRGLTTDDGVSAEDVADIVVSFALNGLRPRESQPITKP